MGLFNDRLTKNDKTIVPAWFMRQAGRYHSHYQGIKKNSHFMEMCKDPKLALEVTMGPIDDFDFDAAILFSDLLFPLEHLGMGLVYDPGPKLSFHVDEASKLDKLSPNKSAEDFYQFQGDACRLLRDKLPQNKSLLGFVGAPITLYTYAAEGGHSGNLTEAKKGFYDGRYMGFLEKLVPSVATEMEIQAKGGIDAICLFDTAVGELDINDFKTFALPPLRKLVKDFKQKFPDVKVIYYSKLTHLNYLKAIECDEIDVLGIDWRMDLSLALRELSSDYMIQGNLDPSHLHLPWDLLEQKLEMKWREAQESNMDLSRWIFGLGHGVLQRTPEENVRKSIQYVRENFLY